MVVAGFVTLAVSVLSAFGVGSVVGAYVNHRLTERRESAREDRTHALELGNLAGELRRGFRRAGAFELRLRGAQKAEAAAVQLLEDRLDPLEGIERALRDRALAADAAWLVELIEEACRSLRHGWSRATAAVVDGALQEVGRTATAFARKEPSPKRPLRAVWEAERKVARKVGSARRPPVEQSRTLFAAVHGRWLGRRLGRAADRRPVLAGNLRDPRYTKLLETLQLPPAKPSTRLQSRTKPRRKPGAGA